MPSQLTCQSKNSMSYAHNQCFQDADSLESALVPLTRARLPRWSRRSRQRRRLGKPPGPPARRSRTSSTCTTLRSSRRPSSPRRLGYVFSGLLKNDTHAIHCRRTTRRHPTMRSPSARTEQPSSGMSRVYFISTKHRANVHRSVWFRPRILRDVSTVDWSTTILGQKSSMPLYIVS